MSEQAHVGPVVTDDLFSYQTLALIEAVEKRFTTTAQDEADWTAEQIRTAYVRGLRDGFAQGVAKRPKESQ